MLCYFRPETQLAWEPEPGSLTEEKLLYQLWAEERRCRQFIWFKTYRELPEPAPTFRQFKDWLLHPSSFKKMQAHGFHSVPDKRFFDESRWLCDYADDRLENYDSDGEETVAVELQAEAKLEANRVEEEVVVEVEAVDLQTEEEEEEEEEAEGVEAETVAEAVELVVKRRRARRQRRRQAQRLDGWIWHG